MSSVKQVIIIRKDLKMRRGKEIAQGAHASMAVILNEMKKTPYIGYLHMGLTSESKLLLMDEVLESWINGSFTKICLVVNSEQELLDVHQKAKDAGLRTALIQDSGRTEFNNVLTYTTCAIGPNLSHQIDEITGELGLY